MAREKTPKYTISQWKRSPFNDLLKTADINDFEFDIPPETLEIQRFGKYKIVSKTSAYVEYAMPKSVIRLRVNL